MFELRMQVRYKRSSRRSVEHAPDGAPATALGGVRTERVTGLEGEVLLDAVNGRKVVVLDFAKLQKAISQEQP